MNKQPEPIADIIKRYKSVCLFKKDKIYHDRHHDGTKYTCNEIYENLNHDDIEKLICEGNIDSSYLANFPNLKTLVFHQCYQEGGKVSVEGIHKYAPQLENIKIGGLSDLSYLSKFKNLIKVEISCSEEDNIDFFSELDLESIDLHGAKVGPTARFSHMKNLKKLAFSSCSVDITNLSDFGNFEKLVAYQCKFADYFSFLFVDHKCGLYVTDGSDDNLPACLIRRSQQGSKPSNKEFLDAFVKAEQKLIESVKNLLKDGESSRLTSMMKILENTFLSETSVDIFKNRYENNKPCHPFFLMDLYELAVFVFKRIKLEDSHVFSLFETNLKLADSMSIEEGFKVLLGTLVGYCNDICF